MYHIPLAVRLRGVLDRTAASGALIGIVARHEVLRTTFAVEDDQVVQVIHSELFPAWREEALADETELPGALAAEARRPFDLVAGPLLRCVLWRLGPEDHVLQLTLHHIVSDGWSLGVLVEEFAAEYRSRCAGGDGSGRPELALQYADYAAWQRDLLRDAALEEELAFWRKRLEGAPAESSVPADRRRPSAQQTVGATHRFEVDEELTRALHDLGRLVGGSLFMVVLGGFGELLRRMSGQIDVVVGTPVANRRRRELEPLIGFFVNTLALRLELGGDPTVAGLLGRVRAAALDAYAHQDLPFEKLVQELQLDRTLGRTPLFQTMFVLQNTPLTPLVLPGLTAEPVEVDTATSKYDLTLALEERSGAIIGRLEYSTGLFDEATARRIASLYVNLLRAMVAAPTARMADLEWLPAQEQAMVVGGWNATDRAYAQAGMAALFALQAAARPGSVAVRFAGAELTYAELDARANRLAHALSARGVGPDTLVAVCLERSLELIVALLGVVKAGGAYVALDPEYPAARLGLLLAEAGGPLVVTVGSCASRLAEADPKARLLFLDRDATELAGRPSGDPRVAVTLEHLAYVSYTSGSTGRPKGVAVPQRGVVRLVQNPDFAELGPQETFLQLAPVAFDASTLEIWAPLLNGGKLVVAPPGPPTLEELGRCLREDGITTLWLTAGLFHLMVDERLDDLGGLRQLLAGGDVLSVEHVRRVLRAHPRLRLINGYGPTENTTFTCCQTLREFDLGAGTVPIGRPIANTRIYVLDAQGRPVPVGVPGELYAGGDGLARGYLGDPVLTAEKFVSNPFGPGRLYRTGDRVRWRADGTLEFMGRLDQQVKIRGHRIEPGEIEAALMGEPGVTAAAVTVREVDGRKLLVGYVSGAVRGDELRARLAVRLPAQQVPAAITVLDALPLSPSGKVDRAALPAPRLEAQPETFVAPGTAAEEILCHLWARVLGVDRIGAQDDFFTLGGHSLLATQLVSRIREAFAVELPLRAVFEAPTVAALARRIDAARLAGAGAAPVIRSTCREGHLPLSFAQERLWFLNQLEPGNPFYNMPAALRLRGRFDAAAAGRVLHELVRRHETLRTVFSSVDGRPVQSILPDLAMPLPVADLERLSLPDREEAVARLTAEEARHPFDLAVGPLLRARLLRLASDEHILLLTMHHIVSDGWSMGVLTREMGALYAAFSQGRASPLPALTVHYADFAAWQRQWLRGSVLTEQLGYWKRQLAGAPPVLRLPTDRPRPPVQSFRGGSYEFAVDRELTERLVRLSRETGATLFMTLQAAFATLLARYCDQEDIVVGTPIANRHRAEIEPLIGFFVNTLVLRTDLSGGPTFRELIARVRRTALDAYAHQDLPFERLVDELQPERDLSRNPVFQVMFALHNTPQRVQVLPDLAIDDLAAERISAQFDLVLDIWETSDGLRAVLEYAADLFDPRTIGRMAGHLQTLLSCAAAAPDTPASRLPLLPAAERMELLDGFNATAMAFPHESTLAGLISAQAGAGPERIAAVHGREHLTYAELDERSNRLARRLRALGVGRNDFVAVLDERGLDFLTAMVGVLKTGAAFLPIDPVYPVERVRWMLSDSAVAILITRSTLMAKLDLVVAANTLRELVLLDDPAAGAAAAGHRIHARAEWLAEEDSPVAGVGAGADFAYMLYTSGSTGQPKGAIVRNNGAVNHIYGQFRELAFHRDTAFLQSAPSSSDISVWQFLAPLLIGGRTVIADYETMCDAARLHGLIRAEGVTLIELVPVVLQALLDHAAGLAPAERALPSLERAMVTGETVPVSLVNRWFEVYPNLPLINAYGPTEAADDICQAVLTGPLPADAPTVPIGRPLPNLSLYVLDRNLQLLPVGVPGEICVSGVGVGAGYWRNEEKTRAVFVANPFSGGRHGDVVYRTGDLGRWRPDGSLEMHGRLDQQVKLRGFRIELGEIESVLGQHPAVAAGVVEVREDSPGDRRLAAYFTLNGTAGELRRRLDALQREQVALWKDLHEDSYRDTLTYEDPTFNVIGWDSNYTGQPLAEGEMREYVVHTVARVRELKPRRVLEIGCGTGLLLFPLAPECERYIGTDLSTVALGQIETALRDRPGLGHIELRAQRADDFTGLEPGSFDLVMLSSVVQYFPSVEYLLKVLEGALRLLVKGGAVFLGDVRLRPLLPAFHASVQLFKASDSLDAAGLRRRIRDAMEREQEMAVEPALFYALPARLPRVSRVSVRPKAGRHLNELTRFRADVTLHLDEADGAALKERDLPWVSWLDRPLSLVELGRELTAERPTTLALRAVANLRVCRELRTLAWLESAAPGESVAAFRDTLESEAPTGLEPEEVRALGEELGYAVQISLGAGAADGSFDVVFQRRTGEAPVREADFLQYATTAPLPWASYANNPLHEKLAREVVPQVRGYLRERLPVYMVPADFVVVEALPLLPSGKVDRRALPAPNTAGDPVGAEFVAPRTPAEERLSAIWAAVLGLERVGVTANFFELGGHSLKATQVVSRILKEFGAEVALRELFNRPTVAELAREVEARRRTNFEAITHVPDAPHYPLSHAQLRLWVLAQMEGASVAYNMPAALLLDGKVDFNSFDRAMEEIAARHEALRTTFVTIEGEPRQLVHAAPLAKLEIASLENETDPVERARALALEDASNPFDLERGPLLRATLLRLGSNRHALLFNLHHIIADDWSLGVFVREFMQAYAALARGASANPPPLCLQYRDYAALQNARVASAAMAVHRDYWHTRLAGELPLLNLATDFPRPPIKTYRGRSRPFVLPAALAEELNELAKRHQASLFMLLVSAVQVLLHRYTDQRDLIVGFPIAGRNHPDLEDQIGFYVNLLPLRADIDPDAPFTALLAQVRGTASEAYEHQAYPFDRIVDDLALARDVTRSPLFDVVVVMQNVDPYSLALDGVTAGPLVDDYGTSKFDLAFHFEERAGTLQGAIVFNTDLFADERVAHMERHLQVLMSSIVADPALAVGRLNMLAPEELRRLLAAANPAPAAFARSATLVDLFEAKAAAAPAAAAVTFGATNLTYSELNARANRLAHRLRAVGVGPNVLVGVFFEPSVELVTSILGVLKAGGAYVPLDPVYPAERLGFMLADARVPVLLTTAALAEALPAQAAKIIRLDADAPALAGESDANLPPQAGPGHAAYVIYTSGSTGRPKGCVVSHHNVVRLFASTEAWFRFDSRDVWTLFHSAAFDFSVWELWGALLYGGRLVVVPRMVSRAPEAFLALLRTERVTVLNQTPSAFRQLMEEDEREGRSDPLALRYVVFGGEALNVSGLRPWFDRHGDVLPQLVNMYGITETTVHVTYRPLTRADCDSERSVIGRPLPDLQLHVLDGFLQPVPVGVPGELFVGGAGVANGYLWRPELTAERFLPDPFGGEAGSVLYRSGDLACRLPNGDLEYLGRVDQQVKIRGFRVELGEIEAALAAHPSVDSALVLVREDRPGDRRLVAYVVLRSAGPEEANLRAHLRQRMPDYMVPAAIVLLKGWPLTPHGKVDRRALPAPEAGHTGDAGTFAPPRDELEIMIASLWAEALGAERVGVNENFFDLGGHSLLIVQLHRRLREALGRELSVVDLFKYSTVAALAAFLRERPAVTAAAEVAKVDEARARARRQQEARRSRRQGGRAS